ncbi:MAG: PD40 domain-containing protein [Verrucomicrobiae bacterium]|nr:PD40 domain-containing protein [Verrucomicrobiae bacterium]
MTPSRSLSACLLAGALTFAVNAPAHASVGVLFYNHFPTLDSPATVRRVNADGSGNLPVPLPLPSPAFPTVSRDGRFLLVTSSDPLRPFKISRDVFLIDLFTLDTLRAVQFVDTFRTTGGIMLTNDIGNVIGDRNVTAYTIHFPNHKAFSPDNSRLAIMDLPRSGGSTLDIPRGDGVSQQTLGGGRMPVLETYRLGDPIPFGQLLQAGGERTGNNQGGDGVDWHPFREEVLGVFRSDIPATSNTGIQTSEGTVIGVFSSAGLLQPLLRLLTTPTARWFGHVDLFSNYLISEAEHDYAPAISPDGTRVAYLRHTQRYDTRVGLAPLPALCELRVIGYDGSGDRLLLRFSEGWWSGKLAWSPDGTQIAFDIAPQWILDGWPSLLGDVTRSEIHVIQADGSNPRRLVAAPATYPTWSPLGFSPPPPPPTDPVRMSVQRSSEGEIRLTVAGGGPGESLRIESSENLLDWTPLATVVQAGPSPPLYTDERPAPPGRARFYRVSTDR